MADDDELYAMDDGNDDQFPADDVNDVDDPFETSGYLNDEVRKK
jgi:hypothetical protein